MGEIILDWEGHDKALSNKLWEFFKEEYLVDFNVTCHGQQKKVHKSVLAFLFPMLKESFRSRDTFSLGQDQVNDGSSNGSSAIPESHILNLDNIAEHAEDMNYLIQFAYTGKASVPKEHADCLMHIADTMEIKSLKDSLNRRKNIKRTPRSERNDETEPTNATLGRRIPRTSLRNVSVPEQSMDSDSSIDSIIDEESDLDYVECSDSSDEKARTTKQKHRSEVERNKEKKSAKSFKSRNSTETLEKRTVKPSKDEANSEEPANERKTRATNDKGGKMLKCPHCDYVTTQRIRLQRHMKSHAREQEKDPKQFSCRLCKKKFETRTLLDTHRDSNCGTEPLVCKYCGHETRRKIILLQHMMAIHQVDANGNPLEKNIKCPDCDFVCYANHQLRIHARAKHERIGKYKCKECNFTAPYVNYLLRHERIKHQNVRNFMCEECGFRFQNVSHLNRHVLRKHKGVKPYKCDICNAEYSDPLSFKIHMQRHEGKVEYKFVCHICGHNLRRKYELKNHMRKKHGMELEEELSIVDDCNPRKSEDTS